jgi:hypothetical protein
VNFIATRSGSIPASRTSFIRLSRRVRPDLIFEFFARGSRRGWRVWGNQTDAVYSPNWPIYKNTSVALSPPNKPLIFKLCHCRRPLRVVSRSRQSPRATPCFRYSHWSSLSGIAFRRRLSNMVWQRFECAIVIAGLGSDVTSPEHWGRCLRHELYQRDGVDEFVPKARINLGIENAA